MEILKPGDVVTLVSGVQLMTVEAVTEGTSNVTVLWFDDNQHLQRASLAAEALKVVPVTKAAKPSKQALKKK